MAKKLTKRAATAKTARAVVAKRTVKRIVKKPTKPTRATTPTYAGISSAAVEKATGHGWDHWLKTLDKAGARDMPHKQIATLLHEKHNVPEWWAQMVTVGYEQARGLREKHQTAQGYQVSASKTINIPLPMLYESWADQNLRQRWLPDADLHIRKATPNKSMRITVDPSTKTPTSLEVNFYPKGDSKSQVALGHTKIKSAAAAAKWKKYWGQRLETLKEMLEA